MDPGVELLDAEHELNISSFGLAAIGSVIDIFKKDNP